MMQTTTYPKREPDQQSPRVPCHAETFAEWEATAEPFKQLEFGQLNRSQRSLYDMLGQTVFLETYFPWSCFEHTSTCMIAADFTIKSNSSIMDLARKHGGEWAEGYYMDPGYGWPVFCGDDCGERCFAFLVEWKKLTPWRKA